MGLETGAAVLVKLEKVLLVAGLLSREADVSSVLLKAADADINALQGGKMEMVIWTAGGGKGITQCRICKGYALRDSSAADNVAAAPSSPTMTESLISNGRVSPPSFRGTAIARL